MTNANHVSEPQETPPWMFVLGIAASKREIELAQMGVVDQTRGLEYRVLRLASPPSSHHCHECCGESP